MPASSAKTRARDVDRAQTCALLDAAYGEGQLSSDEYTARTTHAMHAATLGELRAQTSDLQVPGYLRPPPRPARRSRNLRRRGVLLTAGTAAAAAGAVVFFAVSGGSDTAAEPDPAGALASAPSQPAEPGEPEAIVIEPIDTLTADGLRQFLALHQQKFGDLTVDRLSLSEDSALVTRALPGQPRRSQVWHFLGGFETWNSTSSRDRDQATVDLAQLDADGLGELFARAPSLVRLPSGRTDNVVIRATDERSSVIAYVEDAEDRSGHVVATLAGEVVEIREADQ